MGTFAAIIIGAIGLLWAVAAQKRRYWPVAEQIGNAVGLAGVGFSLGIFAVNTDPRIDAMAGVAGLFGSFAIIAAIYFFSRME